MKYFSLRMTKSNTSLIIPMILFSVLSILVFSSYSAYAEESAPLPTEISLLETTEQFLSVDDQTFLTNTTSSENILTSDVSSSISSEEEAVILTDTQSLTASTTEFNTQTSPIEEISPPTSSEVRGIIVPELSTDKEDYPPGETANVFGKFFQAYQKVRLLFLGSSPLHGVYSTSEENITTDASGSFSISHVLDSMYVPFYDLFAYNDKNEQIASMKFTDAIGTAFEQCSNDNPSSGNCSWIVSILNGNNSQYYEGQTVSERLLFTKAKIPDGLHTISFSYTYTKGGTHTYDFLTTVNPKTGIIQGGPALTLNPCANLSGPDATICNGLNPSVTTPISVTIPNDTFDSKDSAPGVGAGTSQSVKEQAFETANGGLGSRTITAYPSIPGAFINPSITLTHDSSGADSDTGDSKVLVTITFTSNGCNTGDGCNYLLYFGGHLAKSGSNQTANSNWGPALGSANINGGPYHIRDIGFDGGGGSQDNQIQGANVLLNPPTLTLLKTVTNSNGGTSTAADFQAKIDGNNVAWGVPITLSAGSHTASEVNFGNYSALLGWQGDCATDGSITLLDGEEKVCSITNVDGPRQLDIGVLTLIKTVVNDNGGTATVADWTLSAVSGTTTVSGISGTQDTNGVPVPAGVYTLSESSGPAGYTASLYSCIGGGDVIPVIGNTVTIGKDESFICTITNNDQQSFVIVDKTVINDNGGTKTANDFLLTINGSSTLDGVAMPVTPGVHTAGETNLAGYTAGSWGGDCTVNGSVTVGLGETKTCTITNNDQAPSLTLIKNVLNNDLGISLPSAFTLTAIGDQATPYVLSGAGTAFSTSSFQAGTYTLSESGPGGYQASGWVCTGTGTQNGNIITLALNQSATCTITNDDMTGRMTGGGSVFTKTSDNNTVNGTTISNVRITHGFQIHCRLPDHNDNIQINWNDKTGKAHKFHLETLTSAVCTKDGDPSPPKNTANGFNIFTGVGIGRYDGIPGATLSFVFTDNGEPGRKDTATYLIRDASNNIVLQVAAKNLDQGNHQAHRF
jgi:Prealbumin-like fold domain